MLYTSAGKVHRYIDCTMWHPEQLIGQKTISLQTLERRIGTIHTWTNKLISVLDNILFIVLAIAHVLCNEPDKYICVNLLYFWPLTAFRDMLWPPNKRAESRPNKNIPTIMHMVLLCLDEVRYWWLGSGHYGDVIMSVIASQIISLAIVYSSVYSGADQRKHQSSASLAFVREIHRSPVNSPHKGPVTRKLNPFHDVTHHDILKLGQPYDFASTREAIRKNIGKCIICFHKKR